MIKYTNNEGEASYYCDACWEASLKHRPLHDGDTGRYEVKVIPDNVPEKSLCDFRLTHN